MVMMFKMSSDKKDKMIHKLDKMIEFAEDFKECLEDSEHYDEDDYDEEEPSYRMNRRSSNPTSTSRYRYRRGNY